MTGLIHKLLLLISVLPLTTFAKVADPVSSLQLGQQISERLTVLAYHDVREDIKREYAADQYAISAENLAMQFAWLRDNGYKVVSLDHVLAALAQKRPLPAKAVLLTFDDGLASVYTSVYPLLKLFEYPALVSVVTSWIETEVEVVYENHLLSSRDFLSWQQMREMQSSGLIEIISHSHNMHRGGQGNPQGNEQPLAVTRLYEDGYETYTDYLQRIELDIATSAKLIEDHTGNAPRAIVWPYGKYNADLRDLAALQGMEISFSLESTLNDAQGYPVFGRELMVANPGIPRFTLLLMEPPKTPALRAAQVDLDYVYDPDPVVQEANLGVLLDRIKALGISHVFLQAFADPDADGAADALYFPNRRLPMRADLFNRAAWQLKTRCEVKVFAWMPLLSFTGPNVDSAWSLLQLTDDGVAPDPDSEPRLSVFVPAARQYIKDIYADLAAYTDLDGIHFHDDGRMNEFEDANPAAELAYKKEFGPGFSIVTVQDDPELLWQWAKLKSTAMNDFSLELEAVVKSYRPDIRTSRNLFASALLDERGPVYLAQNFDDFLATYDYVTIMAMPRLEGAASDRRFYQDLVSAVGERPGAFQRTVFQLQTIDWRNGHEQIPSDELLADMRRLQSQGVRNLAYYPDDFLQDHPRFSELMRGISLSDHPVMP